MEGRSAWMRRGFPGIRIQLGVHLSRVMMLQEIFRKSGFGLRLLSSISTSTIRNGRNNRDVNETVSRVDVNLHYGDFSGRLMGPSPRSGTGGAFQRLKWNLEVSVMSCTGPSIHDGIFKQWSGQFSQSDPIADIQGSCFPCLPTWRQWTRLLS